MADGERPRRRGERDRRRAARSLRARRPRRLRGDADPRERRRRDHPDSESRRTRGGNAAELLRVRHEPRLVRAHSGRDRHEARAAPAPPRHALCRRPRDGRQPLLLPADRRSDLSRDHVGVDGLAGLPLRRRTRGGVHAPAHLVLHEQGVRLLRHGLRRHRPGDRFRRCRDDLREGELRSDLAADVRALRHALGVALARRAQPRGHPPRLAFLVGRGVPAGTCRRARAERGQRSQQRGRALGPDREGAPLLPAGRRHGEGGRVADARPAAAANGRASAPPHDSAERSGLQAVRPACTRDRSAGGHLLDSDGADAEALDPGHAEREHVCALPLLLRRQRLEQPAATQRERGPLGRGALARGRARGASR